MRPRPLLFLALLAVCSSTSAETAAEARYAVIGALGELNGVALQCRYLDQVRRMKSAVVESAPKERSFGLAFDESTNRAFLDFVEKGDRCPGRAGFEQRVGERIEELRQAFGAP